jgi:hypothetical protein
VIYQTIGGYFYQGVQGAKWGISVNSTVHPLSAEYDMFGKFSLEEQTR